MPRLLLLVSAILAASVALVPPASAGTIDANVVDGILTVTGRVGDEGITVRCEAAT